MLTIKKKEKSVSIKEIKLLEQKTGVKLPEEYKHFLLKNNGGVPFPDRFVTKDGKIVSGIQKFLPLAKIKSDNLEEEIVGITLAEQIPNTLIPIAITPGDNRLVIGIKGKNMGKIYHWAWDEEPQTDHKPSYRYMRLVADSIDEFLKSLKSGKKYK